MKKNIRLITLVLTLLFSAGLTSGQTVVSIKGDQFCINGKPTYEGRYWKGNRIEGLLINSRMVQGIFDDQNPETLRSFVYPDTKKWDAERNNSEFVEAMAQWKSHGLNCFTLNMQGGSPTGYQYTPCMNPGFGSDGSLLEPYMDRLDRVLKRADELQMVVILGIFYFGQDQYLADEKAVISATSNLVDWLFERGYRNVLIEICNETHFGGSYDHAILLPDRIHELINLVKSKNQNGYRYLVGTSFGGLKIPTSNVVEASDFLLIHGNGAKDPQQIQQLADDTRSVKGYRLMPVINNEDDHFDFDKEKNNFTTSIENYISWGYLDFRFPGETEFEEGYQSVPVDWGINSERKKAFFNKVAEITGWSASPENLSVELLREPQGIFIYDSLPEFSWMVPEAAGPQKGYQILVASDRELLQRDSGNIWNSGTVISNQSFNIELGGEALKSNSTFYWKVRIIDSDHQLSHYSDIQLFKTGSFTGGIASPNCFQIEEISPKGVKKLSEGSYFIDFGKDAFATLKLVYKPESSEILTIRLGEKLLDGRIDRNPGGTIRYREVMLKVGPEQDTYQVILEADERNTSPMAVTLPDSFPVLVPFRYCEIEGAGSLLNPKQVRQLAYFYYFDDTASAFTSSDSILNQVWDLCKYSMKATSFAGYYIDGDRERIPYEADAYLNQLSHYSVDREYSLARKTIEYFMGHPTWPTEWQLHLALMFYQDYMYTGNSELIEKYYEPLKYKTLMALEVEDGLIGTSSPNHNGVLMANLGFSDTTQRLRDIVDWPPAQKDTGWKLATDEGERDGFVFTRVNTVINGLYYQNMLIMAEFAGLLQKPEEEQEFLRRAEKVKKSINELLFNKEEGYYVDGIGTEHGSVHANMMVLAFDIVPEARRNEVVEHIKTRGMACSVYGAQYLLEGLYRAGEGEYALELMTATHDRSWYNMIKVGSTITMEAWDMKYKPNSDWNHAWGAAPANIISRWLWGIQPITPGFGTVKIEPQPGGLESSSITMPTLSGEIVCTYQRVNNRLINYSIDLPAQMKGEFVFEFSPDDEVTFNGVRFNQTEGPIRLSPGINRIIIRK